MPARIKSRCPGAHQRHSDGPVQDQLQRTHKSIVSALQSFGRALISLTECLPKLFNRLPLTRIGGYVFEFTRVRVVVVEFGPLITIVPFREPISLGSDRTADNGWRAGRSVGRAVSDLRQSGF